MENENCAICHKPLIGGGGWIDDDEYGDVHESCLDDARDGIFPGDDVD